MVFTNFEEFLGINLDLGILEQWPPDGNGRRLSLIQWNAAREG